MKLPSTKTIIVVSGAVLVTLLSITSCYLLSEDVKLEAIHKAIPQKKVKP